MTQFFRPLRPPRLILRTMAVTFLTVTVVLGAVFVVLTVEVRSRVRRAVADNLSSGQEVFSMLEARRGQEVQRGVATLAESPTLKAALDTYQAEQSRDGSHDELLATIQREVDKLTERSPADAMVVFDDQRVILASAGGHHGAWPVGVPIDLPSNWPLLGRADYVVCVPAGAFRLVVVPFRFDDVTVGALGLATSLDRRYANEMARFARGPVAITMGRTVLASTLPDAAEHDLSKALSAGSLVQEGTLDLASETYAFRRVLQMDDAAFYALGSVDAVAAPVTRDAQRAMISFGLCALLLAAFASLWLARTLARPIDELSQSVARIAESRDVDARLEPTGSSRELDALAGTFNGLLGALAAAEVDTRAACMGAIRALAAALDARDPYTAGHSERVSALSVSIGRQMRLSEEAVDVLRLGALLHDIGKIGVSDEVLQKPGALTPEEFESIRQHPTLGARILKSIPFLAPHLPIVALHHERPDGRGYPYGLRGDEVPLAARIVHVADAFDAMTSARAYRAARSVQEALAELWRHSGSQFDAEVVEAFAAALPTMPATDTKIDLAAVRLSLRPGSVMAFPPRRVAPKLQGLTA